MEEQQRKKAVNMKGSPSFLEETALLRNTTKEADKAKLIEVLSRLGTLLKLSKIDIKLSGEQPNDFSISPGKCIHLGENILSNSFLTLLVLRYGLEWQIWYQAQKSKQPDHTICDLAAKRVMSEFSRLIPQKSKLTIEPIFSKKILDLLESIKNDHSDFENFLGDPAKNLDKESLKALELLAKPSESLLIYGGDSRLKVKKELLLNKYGCRPFPRPEAYTFASSTASSISSIAFEKAEKKRILLIKQSLEKGPDKTAINFSGDIKNYLKKTLSLPEKSNLILAPSGTDGSLQFAGICQTVFQKRIVHILVASEETGSGVALALEGKHFSDRTAKEKQVEKGALIRGFHPAEVEKISLRNQRGNLKTSKVIDNEVLDSVGQAFQKGKQPVLHIMKQSKLGYSAPSNDLLTQLDEKYGDELLKLIDNSQLRLDKSEIHEFVKRGYLLTITGSKFFTGPPFSGALIIPENLNKRWTSFKGNLPKGFINYYNKNAWPEEWPMTCDLKDEINYGIHLRWYTSIIEIERYFQTPAILRELGAEKFCSYVDKMIKQTHCLEHLSTPEDQQKIADNEMVRSIFPFFVKLNGKVLTEPEAKKLYELLNIDLSSRLNHSAEKSHIGSQLCHLGQPVKVAYKNGEPTGVLRISLGSRVISGSWEVGDIGIFFQKLKEQINQVNVIIRKIQIILEHPEWLKEE